MEREAYARATVEFHGLECSPGVELRDGDDVERMINQVRMCAREALWRHKTHEAVVGEVERFIKVVWPGRAYFIETERNGMGVQIFQPYGLPRSDNAR